MKKLVKKVFDTIFIDNEAKKALLSKDNWIDCVVTQIKNRLPNENIEIHLINVCNNIISYSSSNYPYPGYMDLINNPNKTAISIATKYIDYVCSKRK